jgi:hypothetical protein
MTYGPKQQVDRNNNVFAISKTQRKLKAYYVNQTDPKQEPRLDLTHLLGNRSIPTTENTI